MTEIRFSTNWRSWKTWAMILIGVIVTVLYFVKEFRDQDQQRSLEKRLENLEKTKETGR